MKMKTLFVLLSLVASVPAFAGAVKTKEKPKQCGGYHEGHYHLKCEGENKKYVNRKQGWKNPFHGFTEKSGKPTKQGEMPTSR